MPDASTPESLVSRRRPRDVFHAAVDAVSDWFARIATPLQILGQLGAFIAAIFSADDIAKNGFAWFGFGFWWIIGGLAALTVSALAAWAISARVTYAEDEKVKAKAASLLTVESSLLPLLRSVQRLAALPISKRRDHVRSTISQAMQARAVLFKDELQVRMVLYEVQGIKGSRTLDVVDHFGRPRDVPQGFDEQNPGRGGKVFEWLDDDRSRPKFVPNCAEVDDPDWAGTGNGYSTYISIPIVDGTRPLGMLTVDAPIPGSFYKSDASMIEVIARLLSVAFILCGR